MKRLVFLLRVFWLNRRVRRLRRRADSDLRTIGKLKTLTRYLVAEHIALTSKRGSL